MLSAILILSLPRNIRNSVALQIKCYLYSNIQLLGNETNKATYSFLLFLNSKPKIQFDIKYYSLLIAMNKSKVYQCFVLLPHPRP